MNKHGLSRDIPAAIKLQVRQRDGFGCVICGVGIIEYEHVDPEYSDATRHEANGITILCPTCHSKKTRGYLSTESVKNAMRSPKCLENGFSREVLDVGKDSLRFIFAGAEFNNCTVPLMVSEHPLFVVRPPEVPKGPWRFSAKFFDTQGDCSLVIQDNEWFANSDNWDVEVAGGRIVIREDKRHIHLILENKSPNTIEVVYIKSVIGATKIEGDNREFKVIDLATGVTKYVIKAMNATNCLIGMRI